MNLVTFQTPGRKRQMIFAPSINPHSFVFFFEKGTTGYSYSVRDYSLPHTVTERYAHEFGCSASELRAKATHVCDAPYMDVHRLSDWSQYTAALNQAFGIVPAETLARGPARIKGTPVAMLEQPQPHEYPMLCLEALAQLPKWKKTSDIRRMLQSPHSEDWVTWNLLHLLMRRHPHTWWPHLTQRAAAVNPWIAGRLPSAQPRLFFWRSVSSPVCYERASRERMLRSADPFLQARGRDPRPVEGNSEIDVVIESDSMLIYVEAKLDSDVSLRTTYDPARNQIVRNIDCVLEDASGRTPCFWMFVRDRGAGRAYTQLLDSYRKQPEILCRELAHRDPEVVQCLLQQAVVLPWREIAGDVWDPDPTDDSPLSALKAELRRRAG